MSFKEKARRAVQSTAHAVRKGAAQIGAAVTGTVVAVQANAGGGFTVPAEIGEAETAVLAIGLAVFGIAVGVRLYKWMKGAL